MFGNFRKDLNSWQSKTDFSNAPKKILPNGTIHCQNNECIAYDGDELAGYLDRTHANQDYD